MEWFKNTVGEEIYNELSENGTIDKIKEKFGEVQYIPHDKDKWIEKHVFNSQRTEMKNLKDTVDQYKTELEKRKDLITRDDHKLKLHEMEESFRLKQKETEKSFRTQLEMKAKENALLNLFATSGCIDSELILKTINYDEVLFKDNKIHNASDIIDGAKTAKPYLFNSNTQSNIPSGGAGKKTAKESLIQQYEEAFKAGNTVKAMSLQRQIQAIKEV